MKLHPTNELSSVVLSHSFSEEQLDNFAADPKKAIKANFNINFDDVDVSVVRNTASDIHLALPFYSGLGGARSQILSDDDLDSVSGGEVIAVGTIVATAITVGAVGGTIAAGVLATGFVAGISVGAAAGKQAEMGKNLDGSSK